MERLPIRDDDDGWGNDFLDESELDVPDEFRDINARELKLTVQDLFKKYLDNQLILQAEFQREYVWDNIRASRFIESLILGLPVPPIFVAENEDNSWDIVDGHQRLESLFGFLQPLAGGLSQNAKIRANFRALRLGGLEVLWRLNGQDVTALSEKDRRQLWDRVLTVMSIPRSAHKDLRFALFSRLNLGSVPLNPQELRNCLYRGPYNDLIKELASESVAMELFGRSRPHKRMKDRELILRFFALLHGLGQYRTPFRAFLNDEMEQYQNADRSTLQGFRLAWERGVSWTRRIFGAQSCRLFRAGNETNTRGKWDSRWSDLVFEVETVSLAKTAGELVGALSSIGSNQDLTVRALRHELIDIMVGQNFLKALNEGTTRPENVRYRLDVWERTILNFISHCKPKIEMFQELDDKVATSPYCGLCRSLVDLDDAKMLATGQPGHRYCYLRSLGLYVLKCGIGSGSLAKMSCRSCNRRPSV